MSDNTSPAGCLAGHAEEEWRKPAFTAGLAGLVSVVLGVPQPTRRSADDDEKTGADMTHMREVLERRTAGGEPPRVDR
jgi:hypothetical protein